MIVNITMAMQKEINQLGILNSASPTTLVGWLVTRGSFRNRNSGHSKMAKIYHKPRFLDQVALEFWIFSQ